jgi:hypothetical protein
MHTCITPHGPSREVLLQARAHRSLGVRPARMTLSEVAMHSTSSPDTYACGTFAAR